MPSYEHILAKLVMGPFEECWIWTGPTNTKGYGKVWHDSKYHTAHSWFYEFFTGSKAQIPMMHSCDNKLCCNPYHLRHGTHKENMEDAVRRGIRGRAQKLTKADVEFIRNSTDTTKALALRYNVTTTCIKQVRSGKTFKVFATSATELQ